MDKLTTLTKEDLGRCLRDSLNHLYDPDYLRATPLAKIVGVAGRADTPSLLRRILTSAIEDLEPSADEPLHSRAWRMYNALLYLYVQQMSQEDVADKMGLSSRQVRRERTAGIRALADLLWERYSLAGQSSPATNETVAPTLNQELGWLQHMPPGTSVDLKQGLRGVLELAHALADRHQTRLYTTLPENQLRVAIHPVALRQILLGLLNVVMQLAATNPIALFTRATDGKVAVCLQWQGIATSEMAEDEITANLDMVRQLARLCQSSLTLSNKASEWQAIVALPAAVSMPVLVIDDNADTLQLLQRYTEQSDYQLIATTDPEQAIELAEKHSPRIIVLDVMMPQVDGWDVLGCLRQNPTTAHIPVVVCTVLADASLALSLGAAAFVRKPITQEAFLSALDQAAGAMQSGCG